ncbi:MAG: phosphoadenylyl-sulfate reductase [Thermosynechococcaceae cyanobacterium]
MVQQTLTKNQTLDLPTLNAKLAQASAVETIEWSAQTFGDGLVMSTSFGIQAAVMLHLVTQIRPDIPVIWVDTGYLPPATYRFAEQLIADLKLNIHVYQSPISPARMEAIDGRLWQKDEVDSLNRYDQIRKVEPMQRALRDLGAIAWLAGLRAEQTDHRKTLAPLSEQEGRYKILPILNWTSADIDQYLQTHHLPYHPLKEKGYATVGDWHSSRPMTDQDEHERQTRFKGAKQECGLHLPTTISEEKSLDSSSL